MRWSTSAGSNWMQAGSRDLRICSPGRGIHIRRQGSSVTSWERSIRRAVSRKRQWQLIERGFSWTLPYLKATTIWQIFIFIWASLRSRGDRTRALSPCSLTTEALATISLMSMRGWGNFARPRRSASKRLLKRGQMEGFTCCWPKYGKASANEEAPDCKTILLVPTVMTSMIKEACAAPVRGGLECVIGED